MYKFHLLSLIFILSCNSVDQSKENDHNKKLNESIDFSQVDSYPQFSNCSEGLEKRKEFNCFSREINSFLAKTIKNKEELLKDKKTYNINLFMSIDQNGKFKVDSIAHDKQYNKLIDYINQKASTLDILPALKRGVPVKINFQKPVNIEYANK